jgi:two-component system, cell cycle response regulator
MSTKILTIDDSKTIRLIVAKIFKSFDCTILEGANGLEGLAVASREKPDLILLDYTMPVMDGFEVLAKLRSEPTLKDIPVIMLTTEAARETVVKIARLGVRDYVIKPFKEELLIERVGRVVTLRSAGASQKQPKRFDDPIHVLVVDDKPAIVEQIRAGLANTQWRTSQADHPSQALDECRKQDVDVVLASLSLPKEGAYVLYQNLRSSGHTAAIPVFALCVKTAVAEQARALQTGFIGIIPKPIEAQDLEAKVCRALRLETSHKYFHQCTGALRLTLPKEMNPATAHEVLRHLKVQLTESVDAGNNKLVIDVRPVAKVTAPTVELVLAVMKACNELSLKCGLIGSDAIRAESRSFQEAQNWLFANTFEEALALVESGLIKTAEHSSDTDQLLRGGRSSSREFGTAGCSRGLSLAQSGAKAESGNSTRIGCGSSGAGGGR